MRSKVGLLILVLCSLNASAQEQGGHPVALQLWAGHLSLHEEIRFEGDALFELGVVYGVLDWLELSLALSQMRTWDRREEQWSNSVGFSMHWNVWPQSLVRPGLGALLGMSLMGFEDEEHSEMVAEGLDLGIAWRRSLGGVWQLRAEALGRLQSFDFILVDAAGVPIGDRRDTGFLWSRLLRVGVSLAF